MSRPTRSFKLRLSPAGMDLLIDCHCHLIRATRSLIPWGTTLYVGVIHLSTAAPDAVRAMFDPGRLAGLFGEEQHHVGAPHHLVQVASSIASRIGDDTNGVMPSLGAVYLVALDHLLAADPAILRSLYQHIKSGVLGEQLFDQ